MTLEQFDSATYYVKKTMVQFHGTPLLQRSTPTSTAKLYELDGFYVEVVYCVEAYRTPCIRCCTIQDIDEYLSLIDITAVYNPLL